MNPKEKACKQCYYEIKVKGQLDKSWSTWLNCMAITFEIDDFFQTPNTVLICHIKDQSALRGLLNKLFDLNLSILSVIRCNLTSDQKNLQETKK